MSWGMVASGLVSGMLNIFSNFEQANKYSRMARERRKFGKINARNIWNAGVQHAAMIEDFGRWQSSMEWITGKYQADMILSRADYNMQISDYTSEYNAQLYEQEAQEIWNQLDLDIHWLQMARAAERGDITTSYAHAGVELNSMDTPGQTIMDSRTMEELDTMIVTNNAEIKAGKALDAAAMSRWEGRTVRQQILYEANIESMTTLMNSFSRASSIALQSFMDAQTTRFNAANRADSLLYDAYYDAFIYEQQEAYHENYTMRFLEGFMGGGGSSGLGSLAGSSSRK